MFLTHLFHFTIPLLEKLTPLLALFWLRLSCFLLHSETPIPQILEGNFKEFVTLHHINYVNLFRILSLFKVTGRVGYGQSNWMFFELSICCQTISKWGKYSYCILTIRLSCLFNIHNYDTCTITSHLHLGISSPPARITMIRNNLKGWIAFDAKLIRYPIFLDIIKTLDFLQAVMKARSKDTWAVDEARIDWKSNIRGHPTIKVLQIALDTSHSWASSRTIPSLFEYLIISAPSYVTRLH